MKFTVRMLQTYTLKSFFA